MKKQVIAYVHTHWDREWYREYEIFRMRLLRVFDNVLDMLENNTLPSFYFDGQTSALLDYLEIRPEKEDIIRKFIKEKRLFIGPFYCLVDEFLTDENCFRKNLELGLKTAKDFGCEDFTAYFADTFGHSASTLSILKEFGINSAVVWRGCGDIPSEFSWQGIDTINLVRGYFNDVFSTNWDINKKADFLKNNLDKISEKSGNTLLLPIGADHLGVETNLLEQISEINSLLKDYEIKIGTIFEYINKVKNRFNEYKLEGELRDNSKTFILEGSYSSRLDIKRYNVETCHKLDIADRLVHYFNEEKYYPIINYAYKLLLQNQAHDSICGCSTDDVHKENIIRYKKIQQIADNIIEEIRFGHNFNNSKIINLSDKPFNGVIELKSTKDLPLQKIKTEKGFDREILTNTQKIPITEDYTNIYTYLAQVEAKEGIQDFTHNETESDLFIAENCIGNSNIFLIVENNEIRIGNKLIKIIDFIDNGDSYNTGYAENDRGIEGKILSTNIIKEGETRSTLGINIDLGDILHLEVSLDNYSEILMFNIKWENTKTNHLTEFVIDTLEDIKTTISEDFNNIIKRDFETNYDVRANLPKEKGIEVKANNAPMHRGVCANNIGVVTIGLTQYEIYKTELRIPILRSTGVISNPQNPSRTTPAGPPIECKDLQQLGDNSSKFGIFLGENLQDKIEKVFHKTIVL